MIQKLPLGTIKLISSTQVITSLYSVVKELVENALDAECSSIDVRLEGNGLNKIEVQDNGTGISSVDIQYSCQKHFTSKIRDDSDLLEFSTYGFRGEALFSLCTVADVSIITKTKNDFISKEYFFNHNGEIVREVPTHHNEGTTVIVKNIFHNLPVRKQLFKNSKKIKDEIRKIENLLIGYGLVHYEMRILLKNEKNVIWRKNRTASQQYTIGLLFGTEVFDNLEEVNLNKGHFKITAYLPKLKCDTGIISRGTGDRMFVFVNKRPVLLKDVKSIIKQYFCKYCNPSGKMNPYAIVMIKVGTGYVDVNLEPNKTDVMLQDLDKLIEILKKGLDEIYCTNKENICSDVKTLNDKESSRQQTDFCISNLDDQKKMKNAIANQIEPHTFDSLDNSNEFEFRPTCSCNSSGCGSCETVNNQKCSRIIPTDCSVIDKKVCSMPVEEYNLSQDDIVPVVEILNSTEEAITTVEPTNDCCQKAPDSMDLFEDFDEEFVFDIKTPEKNTHESNHFNNAGNLCDGEQWSRGSAKVNAVVLLQPPMHSAINQITPATKITKRKLEPTKTSSVKKHKNADELSSCQLITAHIKPMKPKRRPEAPVMNAKFSLHEFKQQFLLPKLCKKKVEKKLIVIGKLLKSTLWMFKFNEKLYVVDKARLSEKYLYNELLMKHKFNASKLHESIQLNSLLTTEKFQLLGSMETDTPHDILGRYVSHKVIVDNGFIIKKVAASNETFFICTHINDKIPNYGVNDLLEILDSSNTHTGMVRSKRGADWCMHEATRLSQKSAETCSLEEVEEVLLQLKENQLDEHNLCCHGNLVLKEVYTINDRE